jgi:biotin carboxylase
VARAIGLKGHSVDAAARSRNKLASREAFRLAGLPVPWFDLVPVESHASDVARRIPYPAVIKPAALSGSRGVTRVDNPAEFITAFDRLRCLLQTADVRAERDPAHDSIVVESFIPGVEYAVEAVLTDGRLRILAIFDKPDPLDGPFFEETIYVTPSIAPPARQRAVERAVAEAARAIDLHHGPIHAECRVDGDQIYVLEVAARPIGGLCSRALRFQSGSDTASLEEILLRHAIGEDISGYARELGASGVMMIPIPKRGVFRRVEGVDAARAVSSVEDIRITAKPESLLVPLPEGKSYLGFIFARAAQPAAVERALRDAHARLQFVIEREVVVTSSL